MPRLWFSPPVSVSSEQPGLTIVISSVERAAERLLVWEKRGPKWRLAVEACTAALNGTVAVDEARAAFLEAAKESGNWIDR